jgi:hypothetical protein
MAHKGMHSQRLARAVEQEARGVLAERDTWCDNKAIIGVEETVLLVRLLSTSYIHIEQSLRAIAGKHL